MSANLTTEEQAVDVQSQLKEKISAVVNDCFSVLDEVVELLESRPIPLVDHCGHICALLASRDKASVNESDLSTVRTVRQELAGLRKLLASNTNSITPKALARLLKLQRLSSCQISEHRVLEASRCMSACQERRFFALLNRRRFDIYYEDGHHEDDS